MIPELAEHFTTVTRKRFAGGAYVDGRWVAGASSELDIVASVQPASSRDLLRLPEGLRTRKTVAVITDDDLQTANESLNQVADRLEYLGEEWEVVSVDDWTMGAVDQLRHRDCLAQRVDRAGASPP